MTLAEKPSLPADPDLPSLHRRDYVVKAWKVDDATMLLRGTVLDRRPGGMFAAAIQAAGGSDDGRPFVVHEMVVDLRISFPQLVIENVEVLYEAFPQPGCPSIAEGYKRLVGLSIARGFTSEVRKAFGGPRGCTHVTALLQAMAPVAVQSIFAMSNDRPGSKGQWQPPTFMRDTCHVWSSEGELWHGVEVGRRPPLPLTFQDRARRAGVDPYSLGDQTGDD